MFLENTHTHTHTFGPFSSHPRLPHSQVLFITFLASPLVSWTRARTPGQQSQGLLVPHLFPTCPAPFPDDTLASQRPLPPLLPIKPAPRDSPNNTAVMTTEGWGRGGHALPLLLPKVLEVSTDKRFPVRFSLISRAPKSLVLTILSRVALVSLVGADLPTSSFGLAFI